MHTITFHASKGGSGRTTATMALASGLLTAGKRVTVLDCTSEAGTHSVGEHPSTLQMWNAAMRSPCQRGTSALSLVECRTEDELEDGLASAKTKGSDIVLIDTQAHSDNLRLAALDLADLIVLPATGIWEARCAVKGIKEHFEEQDHIFGLITGNRHGAPEAERIRAAYRSYPVFQSSLPYCEAMADQILHGNITTFTSLLACSSGQPGYGRFVDARTAWVALLELTVELLWTLRGLRLEQFCPTHTPYSFNRKSVA